MTKQTKWIAHPPSKDRPAWASTQSDQSLLSARWKLSPLAAQWVYSEDSDQTGRMPMLIWIYAGRTGQFIGFVMLQLISWSISMKVMWLGWGSNSRPKTHCWLYYWAQNEIFSRPSVRTNKVHYFKTWILMASSVICRVLKYKNTNLQAFWNLISFIPK